MRKKIKNLKFISIEYRNVTQFLNKKIRFSENNVPVIQFLTKVNFTGGGGAGFNRLVSLPSLNIYFQTEHAKGKKKTEV